jgi:hypothetical protein
MATKLSTTYKNYLLDGFTGKTALDSNWALSNNTRVQFWTGVSPGPTSTPAGTNFMQAFGGQFSWGPSAAGGVRQISAPKAYTLTNTGTLGFIRLGPNNTDMIDLDASLTGGGGEVILDDLSGVNNDVLTVTACAVRWPATNGGTIRFNTALQNALADMVVAAGAVGMFNSSTIDFYSGTQPTSANDGIGSATLLGSRTFATSHINAASGGSATITAGLTVTPSVTGTVTWARITKGTLKMDISVGVSGTDMIVGTASFVNGVSVTIDTFTLSL